MLTELTDNMSAQHWSEMIAQHEFAPESARTHGAREHVPHTFPSVDHHLNVIASCLSQIIRGNADGDPPHEHLMFSALRSVRRVLMIQCDSDRADTINSLYDFIKCRCDADVVAIIKDILLATESEGAIPLEEDWQLNEPPIEGRLARDSLSAIERNLALKMLNDMNDDIRAACTDIRMDLSHTGAMADRCSRARRGYQSPWTHLNARRLEKIRTQLDEWSDVTQFTRNEFADRVYGASKHVPGTSRSLGHTLALWHALSRR